MAGHRVRLADSALPSPPGPGAMPGAPGRRGVADLRSRCLVAAVASIPMLLWSPIGRDVLHFRLATPFGLRDDVWLLALSLPVIFYSSWIFFEGALRALRARTLDMMVLVA